MTRFERYGGFFFLLIAAIVVAASVDRVGTQDVERAIAAPRPPETAKLMASVEPDAVEAEAQTRQSFNLRSNQIRTRHLFDGVVTAGKVGMKTVAVTVLATAATGSSAVDADLAGGVLIACNANSNQDQHMDNAVLNADGSITITLAANATANNVFRCVAFKANAKGIT